MNNQARRALLRGRPRTRLSSKPRGEEVALPEEGEEGGALLQGQGGGASSPGGAKAEEETGASLIPWIILPLSLFVYLG